MSYVEESFLGWTKRQWSAVLSYYGPRQDAPEIHEALKLQYSWKETHLIEPHAAQTVDPWVTGLFQQIRAVSNGTYRV